MSESVITQRHSAGVYTMTTANGSEYEVTQRFEDGVAPYWMGVCTTGPERGGYVEAMTLREVKRDLAV